MSRVAPPLLLAALFGLLLALAEPYGEFPLNDDWVYARTVRVLVEDGHLEVLPYAEAAHVAQAAWGALFCLPAGFSHVALRLSTALLGLAGVLATYALLREAGAFRGPSFLGAFTVAVSPLYFSLSVTFMTDVPFAATTLVAVLLLARGLRRASLAELTAGTALGVAAVLTRQVGLLVFVAYGVAALRHHGWPEKPRSPAARSRVGVVRALAPGLAGAAALVLWHLWATSHGVDWLGNDRVREALAAPFRGARLLLWRALVAVIYLGLLALPALLPAAVAAWRGSEPRTRSALLASALVLAAVMGSALARHHAVMPLADNLLFDAGLGPLTLEDRSLSEADWPEAPRTLWIAVTVLGVAGGVLLICLTVAAAIRLAQVTGTPRGVSSTLVVLAGTLALSYFCVLLAADFYDRDLVLLVPLILVLAVTHTPREAPHRAERASLALGSVLAMLLAAFTVAATHDYLAWNRARWTALRALMASGIPPLAIDGGYEFNGTFHYGTPEWWLSGDQEYVVAFAPAAGYREIARFPYRRLVPPGEASIVALRRLAAP